MGVDTIPRTQIGSLAIQRASWRDILPLYRLEKLCFPQDSWPLLDIALVLILPGVLRLKVVDGERLVGFMMVESQRLRNLAWIATFAVHPDFRGQGIGTALLAEGEKRIRESHVRLSVRMSNEIAIRLYKRSGYRAIGNWPRYYRGGEDALIMEKELARRTR